MPVIYILLVITNTPLPKDGDEADASVRVAADFCVQRVQRPLLGTTDRARSNHR